MPRELIRLTESFASPGVFWNSQSGIEEFSATLNYSPDGRIELHAGTRRTGVEQFSTFSDREIPLLFGVLSDGTPCNCFGVSMISNSTALSEYSFAVSAPLFHCQLVLIGDAASFDGEPQIDSFQIMSDSLNSITGLPAIPYENNEGNLLVQFINTSTPVLEVDIGDALFGIKFDRRVSIKPFGSAEGSYEPIITLVHKESKQLTSYLGSLLSLVVGLLTMLMGSHAAPNGIRVIRNAIPPERRNRTASLLFNYMHEFPRGKPQRNQVLTMRALGENASKVINSWFTADDKSLRIFNLYLGTLYTDAYIETHFLSLAQAVESFHRVFYETREMPNDIFEKLKNALCNALETVALPSGVAEKLTNGFQFLNEPNFQTRIEALIEILQSESRDLLTGGDQDQFIRTLKQTRNYLTHPGTKKKSGVLSEPVDYLNFNRRLQAFLRLLILRHLGVSEEAARNVASVNMRETFRMVTRALE